MKKTPLKGAQLLLTAALVAAAGDAANLGTLLIPENKGLIDAEYFTMGAIGAASWYVALVEDTTNGQRYVMHYDRPFRREVRPAWVFEARGVPMAELRR